MILIVGAGSSLIDGVSNLSGRFGENVVYMSRQKPGFIDDESWIKTDYNPDGSSVDRVREIKGLRSIVWLASPMHRGLLVNQERDSVSEALSSGPLFQTLLARVALPQMVTAGFGRFVFAGSSGAKLGSLGAITYMQVKAAQAALSKGLAIEYGSFGITSNVINLGVLDSGLSSGLPHETRSRMLERTPGGRRVSPDDFWSLVSHILANPSLNGAEIALDAGYS